ncbi:MAG: APC family permease, partial [Brevibacterium sp.]|nr:APC family permease [Brevibacterium sp.]
VTNPSSQAVDDPRVHQESPNFPLIFLESQSVGAPLMVLAATVILLLFSTGFTWMTPHVPDAGAFYSYIDRGLGRRPGLGAAAVAVLSYLLLTVSMTCYLGVQTSSLIELWTGITLPWWLVSAIMLSIVGLLGFRQIDLSAKVLGVVLILEVIAVLAIDIGVLVSGRELAAAPFSVTEAMSGAPGLGLLFAFLGFFGFEATAVFRSEARDPLRTVPRATYIAVTSIGVLYLVSSWLIISGLGSENAVAVSAENPDSVIVTLAGEVVAPIMADIVQILVVSSMFACMLAFHNIVTRYLFTLGQRRVLPEGLGRVHPHHQAPSAASAWVSGLSSAIVVISALAQLDPVTQIYAWYSGAGAVGVILMMVLTSLAVIVFGSTRHGGRAAAEDVEVTGSGRTGPSTVVLVTSALGGLGLLGVLSISIWNFPLLVGGTAIAVICGIVLTLVFLAGLLVPDRSWKVGSAN